MHWSVEVIEGLKASLQVWSLKLRAEEVLRSDRRITKVEYLVPGLLETGLNS